MVSAMLRQSQKIPVGDKVYEITLRPHRDYKPYTIYLQDFRHSVYTGTDIPKDFRSRVHITGPGESRDAEIYMNAPLRYQGETFYQAGVLGRDEGTILQVVRNPGALLPYIACAMVILGLVIHFGISLLKFLKVDPSRLFLVLRRLFGVPVPREASDMNGYGRIVLPAVVGVAAIGWLIATAIAGRPGERDAPAPVRRIADHRQGQRPDQAVRGGRARPS